MNKIVNYHNFYEKWIKGDVNCSARLTPIQLRMDQLKLWRLSFVNRNVYVSAMVSVDSIRVHQGLDLTVWERI